jgi:hypothetical protein
MVDPKPHQRFLFINGRPLTKADRISSVHGVRSYIGRKNRSLGTQPPIEELTPPCHTMDQPHNQTNREPLLSLARHETDRTRISLPKRIRDGYAYSAWPDALLDPYIYPHSKSIARSTLPQVVSYSKRDCFIFQVF